MVPAEVYTAGKHSLQELVTSIPGGLSAIRKLARSLPACVNQELRSDLRYAGANTSVTNDSSVVGVVFFAERVSCGTMRPAFAPSHISISNSAVFLGNPIVTKPCPSIMLGTCTYARSGLPIEWPTIDAASFMEMSRCPCSSCIELPEKLRAA